MLIWNGYGLLVIGVALPSVIGTALGIRMLFGVETVRDHSWPFAVGLLVAGGLTWLLGRALKKQAAASGRVLVDAKTGHQVLLQRRDSLFFIPVVYWGYVLAVFGVVLFFVKMN